MEDKGNDNKLRGDDVGIRYDPLEVDSGSVISEEANHKVSLEVNRNAQEELSRRQRQPIERIKEDSKETKRLLIIVLISLMLCGLGAHFVYDMLQGVQPPLYQLYQFTTSQIQRIYSFYYLLNFFVAPFAGILLTKIGVGSGVVLFNTLLFTGVSISLVGLSRGTYALLLFGFSLVGIGNENTINCQVAAVNKWFSGRFLSLAMGLKFTFSYIIGAFSDYFCPELYLISRNVEACFFASGVCAFIGFCSAAGFDMIDHFNQDKVKFKAVKNKKAKGGGFNCGFSLNDISKLPRIFWFNVLAYSLINNVESQFVHICTDMAVMKFSYEYQKAKNFIALFKLIVLVLLPLWSAIVQRIGCKVYFLILSTTTAVVSLVVMIYARDTPSKWFEGSILLFGVFYSLYLSCIWPCISLSLPLSAATVGFGIASSFQMLGNMISPMILGWLTKKRDKQAYRHALIFLAISAFLCVIVTVVLLVVDSRNGGVLNRKEDDDVVVSFREELDRKFTMGEDSN